MTLSLAEAARTLYRFVVDSLPDTAIRGRRQDGLEGVHVLQGHDLGQVGPPANHLLQSILQQTKKNCFVVVVLDS